MPAWVVSRANQYARDHALTQFSVYQGAWNLMDRALEREIIPMARAEGTELILNHLLYLIICTGMALAPWNVLAAGKFRTDEEEEKRAASGEKGRGMFGEWKRNEKEKLVCTALEKVAGEVGTKSITAGKQFFSPVCNTIHSSAFHYSPMHTVAIAYLMQKTPYVFPIVGGRKVEHLIQNLEALDISLSDEQIKYLESIVPFDLGFPSSHIVCLFFGSDWGHPWFIVKCVTGRWCALHTRVYRHCQFRQDALITTYSTPSQKSLDLGLLC